MLVRAGRKKKEHKTGSGNKCKLGEGWMFSGRLFPSVKGV